MKSKITSILTIIFFWSMAIGLFPENCSAQSYENKEITLHGTYAWFFDHEQIEQEGKFNTVVILDDNYILWGKVDDETVNFEDIEMSPIGMFSITEAHSFNLEFIGNCTSLDGDVYLFHVNFGKKRFSLFRKESQTGIMIGFEEYKINDK